MACVKVLDARTCRLELDTMSSSGSAGSCRKCLRSALTAAGKLAMATSMAASSSSGTRAAEPNRSSEKQLVGLSTRRSSE